MSIFHPLYPHHPVTWVLFGTIESHVRYPQCIVVDEGTEGVIFITCMRHLIFPWQLRWQSKLKYRCF
jgi:hypothetical protein